MAKDAHDAHDPTLQLDQATVGQGLDSVRTAPTIFGGRYRFVRELGRGGQKVVYLVRDTVLERECALALIEAGEVLQVDVIAGCPIVIR